MLPRHLRRFPLWIAASLLLAGSLTVPARAATTVVPSALAAVEGNTDNGFPFNINNSIFSLPSMRYQQVYASSEFSGPQVITEIRFRPDGGGKFWGSLH